MTNSTLVYVSKLVDLFVSLVHQGHDSLGSRLIGVNNIHVLMMSVARSVYPHEVETKA